MSRLTMREAISQAMWEEMEKDPSVFILAGGSGLISHGRCVCLLCGQHTALQSIGRSASGHR